MGNTRIDSRCSKIKKLYVLSQQEAGAKGIKLKNLQKIKKNSLLEASIQFAKKLNFVDKIVVSSENKRIINIAKK